jgi:hypothetical protein
MTEKTIRRESVSRRTLLSGTAGLLGGAALSSGGARAQATAPANTGAAVNPPASPRYPDPAWLALRQEEIIEPGLEIVDPHHHLWDRPGHRFLIEQLLADTGSGHNITQTVFYRVRLDVPRRGPGRNEACRRNRVRQWDGRDECQRPVRADAAVPRHRRSCRSAAG